MKTSILGFSTFYSYLHIDEVEYVDGVIFFNGMNHSDYIEQ